MRQEADARERQQQEAKIAREKAELEEKRRQDDEYAAKKSVAVVEEVQVASSSPGKEQHSSVQKEELKEHLLLETPTNQAAYQLEENVGLSIEKRQ